MTKEQKRQGVAAFNELYPIGTSLIVVDDNGNQHTRKLTSAAWLLGGHTPVAMFEGISGCYMISRVRQQFVGKKNDLGMSYHVPADANGKPI